MTSVYELAKGLAAHPSVPVPQRLTLDMVFHTICGDTASAAVNARNLVAISGHGPLHPDNLPLMLDCVTSLRRGGAPGESEELCKRVFDAALRRHCHSVADAAFTHLIEMLLDSGADEAAMALRHQRAQATHSHDDPTEPSVRIALARLAVSLQDWDEARRMLEPRPDKSLLHDTVTMSRSAALANMIRIEVGIGAPHAAVSRCLDALVLLHKDFQTIGAQDYETCSIVLAQRYLGHDGAAERTLRIYMGSSRRDTRPVSRELARELDRINYDCDASRSRGTS